jgi:methylglutaconyl-CoA hydratase
MEHLAITIDGPRARVELRRPGIHNAFDDVLVSELAEAAGRLADDDAVRVVVLSGAGKSFCAGADLNWMKRMIEYGREENLRDAAAMAAMFSAWDTFPKPVVGSIHGAALGGGTGLVAVCDIAIAADDTVFAFSEVRLGILPAVISPFVTAKIGRSAARELFLTGERFGAERAREIGLVHRTAPAGELDAAVDAVVQDLLRGGPRAQSRIKSLLRTIHGVDPGTARTPTVEAIADARAGAEGQEGMHAFLERRRPAWREDG